MVDTTPTPPTADELAELIRELSILDLVVCSNVKYIEEFTASDDGHKQVLAALRELQERRERERWIPVDERLPDDDDRVFLLGRSLNGNSILGEGYHLKGGWYWREDFNAEDPDGRVTHWRPIPLPDPPSEVEK